MFAQFAHHRVETLQSDCTIWNEHFHWRNQNKQCDSSSFKVVWKRAKKRGVNKYKTWHRARWTECQKSIFWTKIMNRAKILVFYVKAIRIDKSKHKFPMWALESLIIVILKKSLWFYLKVGNLRLESSCIHFLLPGPNQFYGL